MTSPCCSSATATGSIWTPTRLERREIKRFGFLEGTPEDRPVVLELRDRLVKDLDKGLKGELRPCFDGGQGLVFCASRRGAEKTARFLSDEMKLKIPAETRRELYKLSAAVLDEDPEAESRAEAAGNQIRSTRGGR